MIGKLAYRLFIYLYPLVAQLISFKNNKAKLWVAGRKNIFTHLKATINPNEKIIWMHCSSLGEFEQGRPVLEKLKIQNPNSKILLTFFSPSGYEVRKNDSIADYVFYLPIDSPNNAQQFFDIVNPTLILFVKYDFWYYYLAQAKQRNIPLLLVSGVFRNSQPFFKWYGSFHKQMLYCFTHLFVQNQASVNLLASIGITQNVTLSGDTRFDRVIEIAKNFTPIEAIEKFIGNSPAIVAGSTWTEDDEELDHFANTNPNIKFIIAPHQIEEERIAECLRLYKNSILFSQIQQADASNKNVLIIDNVGMLSKLYHYASICYVGGAFGSDGVHNVLEAAVYGKPVVFGPEYEKYVEAAELIEAGGAISVETALQLEESLSTLLLLDENYKRVGSFAGNYAKSKAGATDIIISYCKHQL
jgi:3-deoxy-D-manno-octulosonic-acid transferase